MRSQKSKNVALSCRRRIIYYHNCHHHHSCYLCLLFTIVSCIPCSVVVLLSFRDFNRMVKLLKLNIPLNSRLALNTLSTQVTLLFTTVECQRYSAVLSQAIALTDGQGMASFTFDMAFVSCLMSSFSAPEERRQGQLQATYRNDTFI